MRTIEQIRALLITATDETERKALIAELEQALQARKDTATEPTKVEQLRSQLSDVAQRRSALADEYEQVTRSAVDDNGDARDFTAEEAEKRGNLRARLDVLDEQHVNIEDQVRQAEEQARKDEMREQVAEMRRSLGLADMPVNASGVAVTREHRTYEKGNGVGYLYDLTVQSMGPGLGSAWSQAQQRLQRHAVENHHEALELEARQSRTAAEDYFVRQMVEAAYDRKSYAGPQVRSRLSYRALSTAATAGGEFVPPMYLTEQWIAFLRAGRVVANCMHHEDLPDGTMSLNIPKVVSGTSVDVQATQNTNVSDTDITTEYVTFPVVTVAGAQIISLQLLERSPVQFDEIIMADLAKAHAQRVDLQVLNGSGSGGQVTGILNTSGINTVTWTQGTPNVQGLYGQLGQAKLQVATNLFLPATHCFMAPVVWEWIGQSHDTQNRPLVVPEYAGPFNAYTVSPDDATAEGVVGRNLSGLQTFEDNNIPQNLGAGTNQSVVVVSRAQENYLYESPVVTRALPQTYGQQLSVLLQLYNYMAFTGARYPQANSVITGTGLASANLTYSS